MNGKRKLLGTALAVSLGVAISAFALPAGAATFVVNSTADSVDANPGDGVCADSGGNCTLRAAVMEANALAGADTIDLTGINDPNTPIILTLKGADEEYDGTVGTGYTVTSTHDASIGDLNITGDTTIIGAGAANTIVEWAAADQADGSADRVFHIEAVDANITVTISGLTVTNGYTPPVVDIATTSDGLIWQFKRFGGGIAIGPSAATALFDPAAEGGSGGGGSEGGGDSGGESSFTVTGVTLTDVNVLNCQSGSDGGGIFVIAPLTLADSVISGNYSATNGGGLYLSAATTITGTTIGTVASIPAFANPNQGENGGGIFDTGLHTTTIGASSIIGNTAVGGAAIAARSTVIDNIENTTIAGNVAQDVAGGIATNGVANLKNVTLANNSFAPSTTESGGGAGLYSFGSGSFTAVNTIVSNNTIAGTTPVVSNCGGAGGAAVSLTSSGHNLEDGDSCGFGQTGDLKNSNPMLEALANNGGLTETMGIPQNSPAIDAGDDNACPNSDQRGQGRRTDGNVDGTGHCDIGAFELFVDTADLNIRKMSAPDRMYATDPLDVVIEIQNSATASTKSTSVVFTSDPLPAAFTYGSASATTPAGTTACSMASNVVTCNLGDLDVGAEATVNIKGVAKSPGTMKFTGHISAASPADPFPGNNSTFAEITVVGNSDLSVTATGSGASLKVGTETSLNLTVSNHGADTANNVRVAATLRTGLAYKLMTMSQGSCNYSAADSAVTCDIGSIPSGGSVTGTLTVSGTTEGTLTTIFEVAADERDVNAVNDIADVSLSYVPDSTDNGGTPPPPPPPPADNSGSSSGGGCAYSPNAPFDPTLPAIFAIGLIGLLARSMYKRMDA